MFDYESPIRIVADKMKYEYEENIVKAVQNYFVDVDKERLQKALEYDSDQYKKGWQDGYKSANAIGRWIADEDYSMFTCSVCGGQMVRNDYPHCCWCGAYMTRDDESEAEDD